MSKSYRTTRVEIRQVGDGEGVVAGYATTFNSFKNDRAEIFAPGCFREAIRTQHTEPLSQGEPSRFAVCWGHCWGEPVARAIEVAEDDRGLRFVDQMELIGVEDDGQPQINADKWEQIKAKLVNGVSIEFDPTRSEFELLSEADARALGYEGKYDVYWPPRRWTKVFLYGWSYVIHPAQNDARIIEVRAAQEGDSMDEETLRKIVDEILTDKMAKIEDRLGKLESMQAEEPSEEPKVEIEIEPESPEMRTLKSRLEALEAERDAARLEAWTAKQPEQVRAMSLQARAALYSATQKPGAKEIEGLLKLRSASPSIPLEGDGAPAPAAPSDLGALYNQCLREAKGDRVRAANLYESRRIQSTR